MLNSRPDPEIGQIADTLHAGEATFWTEQTGLIVDKEPNPITDDTTYGLMFADGKMGWCGKDSMANVRWPQ